jgi:hypothetical protein
VHWIYRCEGLRRGGRRYREVEAADGHTDDEMVAYHGSPKRLIDMSVCACNFDLIL